MKPTPIHVTVDTVLFTELEGASPRVLMVRRRHDPFAGHWALPGGFVEPDEDLPQAAARELREETGIAGLPAGATHRQLGTYGAPGRDPRGRTVSVVYVAGLPGSGPPVEGADDAEAAAYLAVSDVLGGGVEVAFDHLEILKDAAAATGLALK